MWQQATHLSEKIVWFVNKPAQRINIIDVPNFLLEQVFLAWI
jgi:hypothetical protein